jgi:hypothetical protein
MSFERRRRLVRVGVADAAQRQRARRHGGQRAVVVDGQRRVEHRLQALPGGAPAFDQRQHPAGGEHRPDQLAKVHGEAGQRADGQLVLPYQVAAQAQGQAAGGGQGQADGRFVGRFPDLRAQAGVRGVLRPARNCLALRCSRPSARRVRTPDRVSCTWSLRALKRFSESVEAVWIWPEMYQNAHRHQRERQQRDGRPGASRRRAASRRAPSPGQRAVEAGQHRLRRRPFRWRRCRWWPAPSGRRCAGAGRRPGPCSVRRA